MADHLHHFGQLASLPQFTYTFLKVIWHATVWVLLKERNNRIFNSNIQDVVQLLETVKFMSFSWLKAKSLTSAFSCTDWWRHPLLCMGVGH